MQVELLMPLLMTAEPGNVRYVAEMLFAGPNASNSGVSYHPFATLFELG